MDDKGSVAVFRYISGVHVEGPVTKAMRHTLGSTKMGGGRA
jgi:hypothetical protein